MARIKWNIKSVKKFVEGEDGNGCKLLSKVYINSHSKLEFLCGCGENIFETTWSHFYSHNKRQCNKCSYKTKTQEQFEQEVYELMQDEYTVIGRYINDGAKIKIKHNKCGNEWNVTPNNFLKGHGCPECGYKKGGDKKRKTQKEFIKEVYGLSGNDYSVLGKYINNNTKLKMKHNVCGFEWDIRPSDFLRGKGCPECAKINIGDAHRKTHDEFIKEIYNLVGNEYNVLGIYVGSETKILMRHNVCNHEWNVKPGNFLNQGNRCPRCNESKGERKIRLYLEKNNITYVYDESICENLVSIKGRVLRYDFYLSNYNILIEYDGEQHYRPVNFGGCSDEEALKSFKKTQHNDGIKNQYCIDNNIHLLRIPYWEFDNLEKILEEWLVKHGVIHKNKESA